MTAGPARGIGTDPLRGLRRLASRFIALFQAGKHERELADELNSHLQLHIDDNLRAGMSPAEARRQAALSLGGVDQTKERLRDQRRLPLVEQFLQDLRFAIRGLASSPGFACVAVLTLAVGIAANIVVFSMANSLLLKPLDIEEPSSAVHVYSGRASNTPYSEYVTYRDGNSTLAHLGAFSFVTLSVRGATAPEQVTGAVVSGNYFSAVGIRPQAGRLIDERDDQPGAAGAAVVSYQSWRRRFQGDPAAIGRPLTVNGHPFTLVGVLPPQFGGEMIPFSPEFWIAWHAPSQASATGERRGPFSSARLTGRMAPGRTIVEVQADLNRLADTIAQAHPDSRRNLQVNVVPASALSPEFATEVGLFVGLLMALVAIVLLVGCLNLANLLMARWASRRGELALRLALGASRARIVRQLMTESLLLSTLGAGGAALLAWWAIDLFSGADVSTPIGPAAVRLDVDWRVLTFLLLASCGATVMFGLLPALQASDSSVSAELKESSQAGTAPRSRTRAVLMVAQLALSTVLLVAFGLLVRSVDVAQSTDRGFVTDGVLAASFDVSTLGYDERRGLAAYRAILDRVSAVPGVHSATIVDIVPLTLSNSTRRILKEGDALSAASDRRVVSNLNAVSRGHFATLGIPLVAGRDFTDRDSADSPQVGIVNQTMAGRFWPGENPIGQRVREARTLDILGPSIEIVGVVRDSKYVTVGEAPRQFLYRPLSQRYVPAATILLSADGDPAPLAPAVRAAIAGVEPDLPLFNVRPLAELTELSLLPLQLATYVAGLLGSTALALAVIGLYGVVSHLVRLRRREIAIRIALGALPSQVVRMVTRQGLRWIGVGLAVGLIISMAFAQFLAGLLYGVRPADPLVLIGVTALLGATAYLSCRWPAQRTSRLDPTTVLREQ